MQRIVEKASENTKDGNEERKKKEKANEKKKM